MVMRSMIDTMIGPKLVAVVYIPKIWWVGLLESEDMLIRDLLVLNVTNACLIITTGEVYEP